MSELEKPEKTAKRRRRTFDEVMSEIDYYAFEGGEGADKFRALKMLAQQQSATVLLSPPLMEAEVIERLVRVNKPYGSEIMRRVFAKAFAHTKTTIERIDKNITVEDYPEFRARANRIVSLTMLYKEFPQIKRSGQPPGYPRKNLPRQVEWCQTKALECMLERERKRLEVEGPLDDLQPDNPATSEESPAPAPVPADPLPV